MDWRRFGRLLRAIRQAQGRTQRRVAADAGCSQTVYSRVERGVVGAVQIGTLERIVSSLGADLAVDVRYLGGRADRLIDRAHASIVEIVVRNLQWAGWTTLLEFSFNVFGERGSVDVLAWHAATRTLLIVEVKSRFTDLQELLLSLGRKLRLVPDEARRELGWDPIAIGRIVVVPGTTESRSILERHAAMFSSTLPARSEAIKRWIKSPDGPISGVWLLSRDVLHGPIASGPSR